jgi:hypothetical protein
MPLHTRPTDAWRVWRSTPEYELSNNWPPVEVPEEFVLVVTRLSETPAIFDYFNEEDSWAPAKFIPWSR